MSILHKSILSSGGLVWLFYHCEKFEHIHTYNSKLPARVKTDILIWRSPFILLNQCANRHTLFHIWAPATEKWHYQWTWFTQPVLLWRLVDMQLPSRGNQTLHIWLLHKDINDDYSKQNTCRVVCHAQAVKHLAVLKPVQPQLLGPVQQGKEGCDWQSPSPNPSPFQRQPCDWLRVWNGQPVPELSSLLSSDYPQQCLQT